MHFTKMHGIGNDYVYVDCTSQPLADPAGTAIKVSDRHFGIGSDGLILIKPSERADFEMDIYNADGSRAKMCGNGIRCVGKYVYDHGLTDRRQLKIDTLSGIRLLDLTVGADGKVTHVRVDMGEPVLTPRDIPVDPAQLAEVPEVLVSYPYSCGEKSFRITCVSMGNPHCVLFTQQDVREIRIDENGPLLERAPLFPEQANVEFINVLSEDHVRMRVWERGSGETWACGTGACAAAVASILNGYTARDITVSLRGGDLRINWDPATNHVFMTGPAEEVFTGDISL